jgi:23S rRNA (cytosine1962-C5)-methyltransferase
VLNTFSYTGGFSVYALAGGATQVHSVDISKDAVRMGDENVALNFGGAAPHASFAEDCFDYLRRTESAYDVVVLDPPAFAKNAKSVPNAARGYKDLNLTALKKIKSGGCCSRFPARRNIDTDLFRKIVFAAAADAQRDVRILHQLTQPCRPPGKHLSTPRENT